MTKLEEMEDSFSLQHRYTFLEIGSAVLQGVGNKTLPFLVSIESGYRDSLRPVVLKEDRSS
jgi:hypothetical protein